MKAFPTVVAGLVLVMACAWLHGQTGERPRVRPLPPASKDIKTGPETGAKVPDFALPDQAGKKRTLASLMGKQGLLLYFVRSADW